ncbi:MAG: DUF2630 family protein [Pseudomonadota bacterium]
MNDTTLLQHINELVEEEQRLRANTARAAEHSERIQHLAEALDQCWDLLRQRRAKRAIGEDPDQAHLRDVETVESYLN